MYTRTRSKRDASTSGKRGTGRHTLTINPTLVVHHVIGREPPTPNILRNTHLAPQF